MLLLVVNEFRQARVAHRGVEYLASDRIPSGNQTIWGRQRQIARPEAEWIQLPVNENLRIVSDVLWEAAHDRMTRTRATVATANGPRAIVQRDIGSKYLLSDFARCATCGWSMTVITRSHGKTRKPFLGCLSHYKRGPHVCPNGKLVPLANADDAILAKLKADALDPSVVSNIVEMVFARLAPGSIAADVARLQGELHEVESIIANLARAIERASDLDPLIAQMRERQQQREGLLKAVASTQTLEQIHLDRDSIEAEVQEHVAKWRETLATAAVDGGRALLREVMTGPLMLTPTENGYRFRGPVVLGELIAGAINEGAQQGVSPGGGELVGSGAHKVASPRETSQDVRRVRGRLRRAA